MLTSKDLESAADLVQQGISESIFKDSVFDRLAFTNHVSENPDNLIVVREGDEIVGCLFFMVNDGIFMSGTTVALELAWNVVDMVDNRARHWFKLLELFEKRAKEMGADYCTISSYVPRMDKMYHRRDYVNDYSTFTKDLR